MGYERLVRQLAAKDLLLLSFKRLEEGLRKEMLWNAAFLLILTDFLEEVLPVGHYLLLIRVLHELFNLLSGLWYDLITNI